jgi:hypothetical protein
MRCVPRSQLAIGLVAWAVLIAPPAVFAGGECDTLPRSALKQRTCNPQAECFASIRKDIKGASLDARRKECNRLPTAGVCHGPDRYDPQADCRQARKK